MSSYIGGYTAKSKGQEYTLNKNSNTPGNVPYSLNRTKVDNSFRLSNTSHVPLNMIAGYDAQGRIVYHGATENPFVEKEDGFGSYRLSNTTETIYNPIDDDLYHTWSSSNSQIVQGANKQSAWGTVHTNERRSIAELNRKKEEEILTST